MKILPLVIHAGIQIPRHTALFSDTLPASSIAVVTGGTVTIACPTPHGVPLSTRIALSITDAPVPNTITAADVLANGDIRLTTTFDHDITTGWNDDIVNLAGFANALVNGNRQLVSVENRRVFTIKPGGTVASITLSGTEQVLEKLEAALVGWHSVTAATATTLTFPTPATVDRSYTVANPTIARNIRVFGSLDLDSALAQFTEFSSSPDFDKACMFIMPFSSVKASRSSGSRSDLLTELSAGTDYKQMLMDGFEVLVLFPTRKTVAHVKSSDLAHGEVLRAVLRTFFGLKIDRSELSSPGAFVASFQEHGGALMKNRATYGHQYTFSAPAYIANEDAIAPWEWPLIDDEALADGVVPDSITPIGAPALRDIDFTAILHDGYPQPLTGTFRIDE